MGIGLSRTSAIALSEFITKDDLDEVQVTDALRALNLEGLGMSPIIVAEIRKVLY
jgi:hypothetical protein